MVKGKKGQNQATTDEGRGKLTLVLAPALYGFKTFANHLTSLSFVFTTSKIRTQFGVGQGETKS